MNHTARPQIRGLSENPEHHDEAHSRPVQHNGDRVVVQGHLLRCPFRDDIRHGASQETAAAGAGPAPSRHPRRPRAFRKRGDAGEESLMEGSKAPEHQGRSLNWLSSQSFDRKSQMLRSLQTLQDAAHRQNPCPSASN